MEEKVKKEKTKKIGVFTTGICLIALGIVTILSLVFGVQILRYSVYAWPILLIIIGGEILYYSSKENVVLKYDFWGVILVIILFIGSMSIATFASVVKQVDPYIETYLETHIH